VYGAEVEKSCSYGHFLFSFSHTFAVQDVSFSHNTLRHKQTDRQTTVSCQQPITRAAWQYDRLKTSATAEIIIARHSLLNRGITLSLL